MEPVEPLEPLSRWLANARARDLVQSFMMLIREASTQKVVTASRTRSRSSATFSKKTRIAVP
jgi:hypothetical protein